MTKASRATKQSRFKPKKYPRHLKAQCRAAYRKPFRSRLNEALAKVFGLTAEEIAQITGKNARKHGTKRALP